MDSDGSKWTVYQISSKELDKLYSAHLTSDCNLLSHLYLIHKMFQALSVPGRKYEIEMSDSFNLVQVDMVGSLHQNKLVVQGHEPRLADNWMAFKNSKRKTNVIFRDVLAQLMMELLKPKDLIAVFRGRMDFDFEAKVEQIETNVCSGSSPHVVIYRPPLSSGCVNIDDHLKHMKKFPQLQYNIITDGEREVLITVFPKEKLTQKAVVTISPNEKTNEEENIQTNTENLTDSRSSLDDDDLDLESDSGDDRYEWKKMRQFEDSSTGKAKPTIIDLESEDEEIVQQPPPSKRQKKSVSVDAKDLLKVLISDYDEDEEENVTLSSSNKSNTGRKRKNRNQTNCDAEKNESTVRKVPSNNLNSNHERNKQGSSKSASANGNINLALLFKGNSISPPFPTSGNKNHGSPNPVRENQLANNDFSSIDNNRDVENTVDSLVEQVQLSLELEMPNNVSESDQLVGANKNTDLDSSKEENVNGSKLPKPGNDSDGNVPHDEILNEISVINDLSSINAENSDIQMVVTSLLEQVESQLEQSSNAIRENELSESSVDGNISLSSFNAGDVVSTPDFINYSIVKGNGKSRGSTKYKNFEDYEAQVKNFENNCKK